MRENRGKKTPKADKQGPGASTLFKSVPKMKKEKRRQKYEDVAAYGRFKKIVEDGKKYKPAK